jgi:hypothetical protein
VIAVVKGAEDVSANYERSDARDEAAAPGNHAIIPRAKQTIGSRVDSNGKVARNPIATNLYATNFHVGIRRSANIIIPDE